MKTTLPFKFAAALLLLSTLNHQLSTAYAQTPVGTTFTYQGRLNEGTNPANGLYDFQFSLSNAPSGGSQVGSTITQTAIGVTNGLFTTTLEFGAVFTGNATWLGISVRTNGAASYTGLSPLQELTPTPYAIYAEGADASGISGALPAGDLSGSYGNAVTLDNAGNSFAGNGTGLTNVNAATLGGLAAGNFWQLGGNNVASGQFLGTLNSQPLDFYADGVRALRLILRTDASGTFSNAPNVIGGSAVNDIGSGVVGGTVAGGGGNGTNGVSYANNVTADFGAIGGGVGNTNGGIASFIGGGGYDGTTHAGNTVAANAATIGGGLGNNIPLGSRYAFIGGGAYNAASAYYATVGGGYGNTNSGIASFIGGGGYDGTLFEGNTVAANAATIGGGLDNYIPSGANYAFIGGGAYNAAEGLWATVGGGNQNDAEGEFATVGGGFLNGAEGLWATVGGGYGNTNSGIASFIGGGGYDGTLFEGNTINDNAAVIGGGLGNSIASGGMYSFIGGGQGNVVSGEYAMVGGGEDNTIQTSANDSTIAGGKNNTISTNSNGAAIAGGEQNVVSNNAANAFVAGGYGNQANGNCAFAAGNYALVTNGNSFVWSDGTATTTSSNNYSVTMRATGGYYFLTSSSAGAKLAPGATSWTALSDRNAKKNFKPVDTVAVLDKLAAIPIEQWNYKWEKDTDVPNIGPMAQDFKHAFYPGRDDKGISTLEFDGVELAAIQGLNQKLNEKDATIQEQGAEIQDLKQSVAGLKQMIFQLAQSKTK